MSLKQRGWEGRLITYLSMNATAPFRPGEMDCGLFFGGAVKVMTGIDYLEPFKGMYRTIEDGQAIVQSMGFADHVEYACSLFPVIENPLFAQRGDGAVVNDINGNPALGVVQGPNIYVVTVQDGLSLVPLSSAIKALRV